jgi:hypothetical protein
VLLDQDEQRLWNTLFNANIVRSGEDDNGLSGKYFRAPERVPQIS